MPIKSKKASYWKKALLHLKAGDKILAKIISRYPGEILSSRGDAYETLLRSIVGQQISVKAAASIWRRIEKAFPARDPKEFLKATDLEFKACGISPQKIRYVRDLSLHFFEEKLKLNNWHKMGDEEVISDLIQVKGIGRWTAEMFLMFHLLRPNILPVADLGLQKAVSIHYKKRYPMSEKTLRKVSKNWDPYQSVATWYLWRSLDPLPVEY